MGTETPKRLQAFVPVCVYQDFSINAARKLSSTLEYVRELLDNSLAPGPSRNAPPGGGPLRVETSLADWPVDGSLTYKVLTYRENGASVGVGSLDNLVNFGHKKTVEVLAEGQRPQPHTSGKPEAGGSSSAPPPPAPPLSVYGEIGQGLPMTINALAARAYLFYNHNGQTHVVTYGQAIHDKDGAVCRGVLILPNKEPPQTQMQDLLHVVKDNMEYKVQAVTVLGHYVRECWREDEHGSTVPLYGSIQELMERARQVPTPGLLYDFVLMKGTSLKSSLNPRTKALDIEDTQAKGSLRFLSEAVGHWYLPGEDQGCELGRHIQPPPPQDGVILSVQEEVIDRFSEEPWVRQRRAPGTSATQVLTMVHPVLGDVRIQILFWPREDQRQRQRQRSQLGQPTDADDDELVDDAAVGGIRLFQSSDRAVWTSAGHVPHCLNAARSSFSWHVAQSSSNKMEDYKHFLAMCGLRDEAAAEAAGLPSKKDFADVKGGREKDVKYWLTLNNMMCYVMVERSRLHDLGLLKETKDDLKDTRVSRELYHIVYRGIAKRIWEERDRIRAAAAAAAAAAGRTPAATAAAAGRAPAATAAAAGRTPAATAAAAGRAPAATAAAAGRAPAAAAAAAGRAPAAAAAAAGRAPAAATAAAWRAPTATAAAAGRTPAAAAAAAWRAPAAAAAAAGRTPAAAAAGARRSPAAARRTRAAAAAAAAAGGTPATAAAAAGRTPAAGAGAGAGAAAQTAPAAPTTPTIPGREHQQQASRSGGTAAPHAPRAADPGALGAAMPQAGPGPSSGRSLVRELAAAQALGSTPVFESALRKRKQPERFSFVTPERMAPKKPKPTRQTARQGRDGGSFGARADQVIGLLESVLETASQLKQAIAGKSSAAARSWSFARQVEGASELAKLSQEVLERIREGAE